MDDGATLVDESLPLGFLLLGDLLLFDSGHFLGLFPRNEEYSVHQKSMTWKGADVRVLALLVRSPEARHGLLSRENYRGRGKNLVRLRHVIKPGAIGAQGDRGLDYLETGTRLDQDEVVHHLINVVESQFDLLARLDVKSLRVKL